MLSAVVGCTVRLVLGHIEWLSGAVGMSLALVVMMLTKTTHPVIHASLSAPQVPACRQNLSASRMLLDVHMLVMSKMLALTHLKLSASKWSADSQILCQ